MATDSTSSLTRGSLLIRLRVLDDREAWNEFVESYTPHIYGWCRRHQLQESDASDVTQDVLGKLVKSIRTFDYDPQRGSFRGWLRTVTQNAIRDFLKETTRPGRGSGDTQIGLAIQAIQAPDAIDDLAASLEREAERELLREAEARVQLRVKPDTWQAYRLLVYDALSPADVAARLNLPVAEIYVSKSRVLKLLREEIKKLDGDAEQER